LSLRPITVLAVAVVLLGFPACKDDPVTPPSGLMQDFSLLDVNSNSFSHDANVSPRQFVGQISAWYFGHAT